MSNQAAEVIFLIDVVAATLKKMILEAEKSKKEKEKDTETPPDLTRQIAEKVHSRDLNYEADMANLKKDMDDQIEALMQMQTDMLETIRRANTLATRARNNIQS